MAKRLTLTEAQKDLIRAASGNPDLDFSQIVAYEARAASTRPISQRSTVYDQAQMTETYLRGMVALLTENKTTLQVMHDNRTLPIGKVFFADVFPAEAGHFDLNALFYLDASSDYVNKLELGIYDEVSVGSLPKHAFCSQCDFDYMADPESMAFWLRECENGHALGQDGVHLRLTDVAAWTELSLVNRGASSRSKILGPLSQRIGASDYQRLAASSGRSPEHLPFLYLTNSPTPQPKGPDMDPKLLELSENLGRVRLENEQLRGALSLAQDEHKTAQETSAATIADLQSKIAAFGDTSEIEQTKSDLKLASDYVADQYKKAMVASGQEAKENLSLKDMTDAINNAQVILAAIPRGGVTPQANQQAPAVAALNASAYMVK